MLFRSVFRFVSSKPNLEMKPEKATVILYLDGGESLPPRLAVAKAGDRFREMGRIVPGKAIALGWMDFQFIPEEYHPHAIPRAEYLELDGKTPSMDTVEVVEISLDQSKDKLWLELGSSGQIPLGNALYYVQYTKREVGFGFDLKLLDFQVGYYPGTMRPATYSSKVEFEGRTQTISMNEPLYHKIGRAHV